MALKHKYKLGFIGAGNMAWAIASGVVESGLYQGGQIIASDISSDRRRLFAEKLQAKVTDDNSLIASEAEIVILAIKPQQAHEVLAPLAGKIGLGQLVVSIMAGVATRKIEQILAGEVAVVRVMPNLALSVGAGMTAIAAGSRANKEHVKFVEQIFRSGGQTLVVDEEQMHAVTAVSGSGPAYFFYFVEAMIRAGIEAGLSDEQAQVLAKQTLLGAAKTLLNRSEEPGELRRQVTSKGGTTAAALEVMETSELDKVIIRAVLAADKRSKELGK